MSASVEQIASRLGFTMQELALNRAGQISERQSWQAIRTAVTYGGVMLAMVVAVLLVTFVIKPDRAVRIVYYFTLFPGSLVVLYIAGVWIRGAVERKVLVCEGSLAFEGSGRGPPSMVIGRARVTAPPHAVDILAKGARYRIFYLAHSRTFLSIEPMPDDSATSTKVPP